MTHTLLSLRDSVSFPAAQCATALLLTAAALLVAPLPSAWAEAPCSACAPDCCRGTIRPQDSIWLVDARCGGCITSADYRGGALRYLERDAQGGWTSRTADDFFAPPQSAQSTIVWVHGDRVDSCAVPSIGLEMYRRTVGCMEDPTPVRYVIYTWPTTKQLLLPLKDARLKFGRTTPAGYRLAWLVNRLPADTAVNLIGYSYGARVITSALHFLGGGEIGSAALVDRVEGRLPIRSTLLAAAVENCAIIPGRAHGLALSASDHLLSLRNSCDRVLKLYPHLATHGRGPNALGYVGVASRQLGQYANRFEQADVCCNIGPEHSWRQYAGSPAVMARVRSNLLLVAASPPKPEPAPLASLRAGLLLGAASFKSPLATSAAIASR